jgi:hypothetical protein
MTTVQHPLVDGPVRLGKLEKKHDPRNLQLARYLEPAAGLPPTPSHVRRTGLIHGWPMYGNDTLGDCTCAAVGHIEQLVSAAAGSPETPADEDVTDLYWETGTADDGRYCLDVLNHWQKTGFGPDAEKIVAFVEVDPRNHEHAKAAIDLFGNLYVGLALPLSAQQETHWTVSRDPRLNEPGGWGGHCVPYFDYTTHGLTCVTWGRTLHMTWGFHNHYCDEAYTIISPDWLDAHGESPGGFNLDQLRTDLQALRP